MSGQTRVGRNGQHFRFLKLRTLPPTAPRYASKYDIAVVYESLAVAQLDNAQGRWGSLHIYYPPVTIWSDHPVVLLDAPWVTAEQKIAGARLIAFLRSTPVQATALRFGFRPAGIRKNYYVETNEDALVMWADDVDSEEYARRLDEIEAGIPGTTIIEEGRPW